MRVLHVISDENIGGAGILLLSLLKNFDPLRVESIVALPRGSALRERVEALKLQTVELKHPCDRFSSASVREIKRILKRERIDLVHANAALTARLAGKSGGIPTLHTRHCCFAPRGALRLSIVRVICGFWNDRLSDHAIATANAAAENLQELGIRTSRITVIPNGSEPIRAVSTEEQAAYRSAWRIPQNAFTVGICARLVPCKGHSTFLQAARRVIDAAPSSSFCFLIAGEGECRDALEEEARALGISDSVRFLGFLRDTAPFYRLLRINVNCSSGTETSCLALSEGMSAGVPMVISDYGGNPAMLGDSNAGILYPARDATALADAILRIAAEPTLESDMQRAALDRYRSHYTAARMTEQVTLLYEKLCSKKK